MVTVETLKAFESAGYKIEECEASHSGLMTAVLRLKTDDGKNDWCETRVWCQLGSDAHSYLTGMK